MEPPARLVVASDHDDSLAESWDHSWTSETFRSPIDLVLLLAWLFFNGTFPFHLCVVKVPSFPVQQSQPGCHVNSAVVDVDLLIMAVAIIALPTNEEVFCAFSASAVRALSHNSPSLVAGIRRCPQWASLTVPPNNFRAVVDVHDDPS
jgi:hypothetical protein